MVSNISIFVIHLRKLRSREVMPLVQDHTGRQLIIIISKVEGERDSIRVYGVGWLDGSVG